MHERNSAVVELDLQTFVINRFEKATCLFSVNGIASTEYCVSLRVALFTHFLLSKIVSTDYTDFKINTYRFKNI